MVNHKKEELQKMREIWFEVISSVFINVKDAKNADEGEGRIKGAWGSTYPQLRIQTIRQRIPPQEKIIANEGNKQ